MTPVDLQKADVPLVDSQGSHIMTGVDKLHAEGITGEGIRIAIIDTGVDYLHPALGGGFGPGFKVAGGYDFVGDDYNGSNEPEPDPDPLDQCYGKPWDTCCGRKPHPMLGCMPLNERQGIAVADPNNPANISGVAYSATINAYRIFGCSGDSTDDSSYITSSCLMHDSSSGSSVIVEALLRAVDDEQDILTMSIGQPDGWTEGTTSVVASRIAASGKVVTVAAGNDGGSGAWFTSAPGNGVDVISVGSVDNIVLFIYNATVHGVEHNPVTYYSLSPFSVNGTLPVWATSNNISITDDACNPLPDNTPNLTDYITLIRRGNCTFVQKATNAYAKGAQTILIYDNGTGFGPIDVGNFTEVALIQAADGEFLVEQIAAGAPVALSFPEPDQGGATQYPNPAGGLASAFSSYGPTNDFFFKPAIAAPGGNILSLLPSNKGSYGVASGTSMATPFVAGSAALILSQLGKSVDMRTLLETTARIVPNQNNATVAIPETVAKQGAGLLDVYNAIHGTTNVSPGELLLNDSTYFVPEHTFTVKNVGSVNKEYQLSHVPAGTALTVNAGTIFTNLGYVPLTNDSIAVDLSTYSFNLEPGQSQSVVARFTAPPVNTSTFPLYSGFIQIDALLDNGSNETTHVSYLGLAASLKDKDTLDNTNVTLGYQIPVVLEPSGDAQTTPRNYTFSIVNGTLDFPTIQMRLVFGTPQLRLDLVYADFTLENATTVDTLGLLTEYDWVSRNNEIRRLAAEIEAE
ncbi:hypothetical protein VNI00_003883 [Paramarasmius palmivorus]|uniref:Uncharacterized protein n=1 Tax=Paramarasmius palmivorus TaxID=297713 RepID=A0AAW0DQI5_9AGAR